MPKIFDENFLLSWINNNLWELTIRDISSLFPGENLKLTKQKLIDKVMADNLNLIDIYHRFKDKCFGMYVSDVEKYLNINRKERLKMTKQEFLKVSYYKETRAYGKYLDVPYFDVAHLVNLTTEDIEDWKRKFSKQPTQKQLEALSKARCAAIENRTCKDCRTDVGNKNKLDSDGLCQYCREIKRLELIKKETVKYFKDIYKNKDRYLILDTESTGLDYDDKIVEVAIIDFYGNVLLNTYVYTEKEISQGAYLVNGITKEMLIGKPTIEEITPIINDIVKDKIILIYNKDFDIRLLHQSGYTGDIEAECLMELYMKYICSDRWVSLQNALNDEKIDIIQDHSALGDCKCCSSLIESIGGE